MTFEIGDIIDRASAVCARFTFTYPVTDEDVTTFRCAIAAALDPREYDWLGVSLIAGSRVVVLINDRDNNVLYRHTMFVVGAPEEV